MINIPHIRRSKSGVPIFSEQGLEDIGEKLVSDFCPNVLTKPQEIDIDRFTEFYMKLPLDFQYLSHCGAYLGMIVYNDTDKLPVYNEETKQAKYIRARAGTVIIDKSLLAKNQEHRYRFTLAHEAAGHAVLHWKLYTDNKIPLYDTNSFPWVQYYKNNKQLIPKEKFKHNIYDLLEWQADTLGSIVLMPRKSIFRILKSNNIIRKHTSAEIIEKQITKVSNVFNVSTIAARTRLERLGFIRSSFYNPPKYINYSHVG